MCADFFNIQTIPQRQQGLATFSPPLALREGFARMISLELRPSTTYGKPAIRFVQNSVVSESL
jgi:hypothetical protein